MPNFSKVLLILLLFFILSTYSISILMDDRVHIVKTESLATIKTATMLATYNIIDVKNVNATYEGSKREPNDIIIDFGSKDFFVKTLSSFSEVKMQDMKVIGFVSYRYVAAVTIKGEKLTPAMYWWREEADGFGNMTSLFEFCLGNYVYVDNVLFIINEDNPRQMVEYIDPKNPRMVLDPSDPTGDTWIEDEARIISSVDYGFSTAIQWRNFTIQRTISNYINNLAAMTDSNTEVYMSHQLDQEDVANVVEGPSVFSIVDINGERIVLLGGAEIKLSNVTISKNNSAGVHINPVSAPVMPRNFAEFIDLLIENKFEGEDTEKNVWTELPNIDENENIDMDSEDMTEESIWVERTYSAWE